MEEILINIRGAKSFKGKLRWNVKLENAVAAPLFTFLAALQTKQNNLKKFRKEMKREPCSDWDLERFVNEKSAAPNH